MNSPTTRKIRTALLSYGMSGAVFHGPLLEAHDGFEIVKVLQRNPNKKHPHSYPVTDRAEEIFKDPEVDLVIVNTPNDTHFEFAAAALNAGKHVVVEKPFTVTVSEADELIELSKKYFRILTVFQNRRWDGDFLTVKKVIENNQVGKIVEVEAHYDRFRNFIQDSWKEKPTRGTGVLYNLGSHMLDQMLVLFGLPLYIDARMGIQRPGGRVDDFYDIRLEYQDFFAIVKSSYLVKEQGPRYKVHGTNGSFVKKGLDIQEQDLTNKKKPGGIGWGAEAEEHWGILNTTSYNGQIETVPGNYLLFYENLYDAIVNGSSLAVQPGEARNVIRLIEACYESNRLKRAIQILAP